MQPRRTLTGRLTATVAGLLVGGAALVVPAAPAAAGADWDHLGGSEYRCWTRTWVTFTWVNLCSANDHTANEANTLYYAEQDAVIETRKLMLELDDSGLTGVCKDTRAAAHAAAMLRARTSAEAAAKVANATAWPLRVRTAVRVGNELVRSWGLYATPDGAGPAEPGPWYYG